MIILHRREPARAFTRDVTCGACESLLRVDAEDLRHTPGDQRGETEGFSVACAVCSATIWIDPAQIPTLAKAAARQRRTWP